MKTTLAIVPVAAPAGPMTPPRNTRTSPPFNVLELGITSSSKEGECHTQAVWEGRLALVREAAKNMPEFLHRLPFPGAFVASEKRNPRMLYTSDRLPPRRTGMEAAPELSATVRAQGGPPAATPQGGAVVVATTAARRHSKMKVAAGREAESEHGARSMARLARRREAGRRGGW